MYLLNTSSEQNRKRATFSGISLHFRNLPCEALCLSFTEICWGHCQSLTGIGRTEFQQISKGYGWNFLSSAPLSPYHVRTEFQQISKGCRRSFPSSAPQSLPCEQMPCPSKWRLCQYLPLPPLPQVFYDYSTTSILLQHKLQFPSVLFF